MVFVRTRRGFQNQRNLLLDERCLSLSFFFSFLYCLFENTNEFVPQCDTSLRFTFFHTFLKNTRFHKIANHLFSH